MKKWTEQDEDQRQVDRGDEQADLEELERERRRLRWADIERHSYTAYCKAQ